MRAQHRFRRFSKKFADTNNVKLPLYIYTNRNIAGCICATVAVIAYLSGIITDYWWEIVVGAYAVPALAIPSQKKLEFDMSRQMDDAQLVSQLQALESQAASALPPDIANDVIDVCKLLESAIPAISARNYPDQVAHDVRTAAAEYLPQTIEAYTKLPPAFRNVKKLDGGKTATQILAEQIALMKTHLQNVVDDIAKNDASALVENGRFLREKFATPEFLNVG